LLDRAVYDALKPAGFSSWRTTRQRLGPVRAIPRRCHRIDPELVKQEVTSAGFVFVAGSDLLHNPEDTHDAKVFELKGRSDKFLLKFRKPGR